MPLTDSRGQGIPYSVLSDKPNAQTMGKGIVDAVVDKLVMVFASATVRGATIPSPTEGMVSYLKDTNLLQVYDGSTWATVASQASAWTTISLNAGFTHNGNSQGTFQYRTVNLFGETSLMFRGGVNVGYTGPGGTVLTNVLNSVPLPAAVRPASLRTIVVPCSDASSARVTLKLDVRHDTGELIIVGLQSDTKPPWVGFHGTICSL